jgi:type IV fimbrial biogenesis protein FimT
MPLRREKGFSLTELLVVILIVGILTAAALPAFSSFIAGQRIKTASFDMMAMLTLARSESIKRDANVTVAPVNSDWAQGWTVTNSVDGLVLNRQNALPGISVTCLQGGVAAICGSLVYNSNGRCANAQSIQLGSATPGVNARCIGVDLSGRPNSKLGNC